MLYFTSKLSNATCDSRPAMAGICPIKIKYYYMNATILFLQGVGFQEILLIGLFVLVFFGAKKIPEFMKGLGKGVREFKDSVKDVKKEVEDANNAAKIEDSK